MNNVSTMVSEPTQEEYEEMIDDTPAILTRDAILNVEEDKLEVIEIPEWSGAVYIRVLSGRERDQLERDLEDKRFTSNLRGMIAARVVANEKGERIFTDNDAEALGQKSGRALERILRASSRINAIDADEIEQLEKN